MALAGCANAEMPLRVAVNGWIGYASLFLAQEQGHAPEAVVRLVEFPSNTASVMALLNHDVAAAALTLDELLQAREGGLNIRAAMVFDESCGADVVMAHPRVATLADLRGKRIGVESTAVGALMLSRLLDAAGLPATALVKVPLTADRHVAAYTSGAVDAVITFEPMASRLQQQGAHRLLDSSRFPGLIVDVLAVSADIDLRQAAQLRQLIQGHFQAIQHLQAHPAHASRLLSPHLQLASDAVLEAFKGIRMADAQDNRQWLAGSQPRLQASARAVGQTMLDSRLLQRPADVADLCDPSFLTESA